MKYPEFIKNGDKIVLTALSDGVSKKDEKRSLRYNKAISNLEKEGFKVEVQPHCFKKRMYRSASAKIRGKEFNKAYFDNDTKLILNIVGGDFEYETLPYIDYKKIKESTPKWTQGYSDTTHLTFLLTTICDVATIYGNGLKEFGYESFDESVINNLNMLRGTNLKQLSFEKYNEEVDENDFYKLPTYKDDVKWETLRNEDELVISGRLIGGCQDVINTLVGTKYDKVRKFINKYKEDGIVWYLETYSMSESTFLTNLNQLKNAGYFKYCKGIVFGRPLFYDNSDMNVSYEKAIKMVLGKMRIPIIYNADIGHVKPMLTLVNGSITTFKYNNHKCEIITELR